MQKLAQSLMDFRSKIPAPEARAESEQLALQAEKEERKRKWVAKLRSANIPPEFKDASIAKCDPLVAEWVQRVMDGSRRNLILQGKPGTLKTYSACAALIALLPTVSGRFTRETDIMRRIRDSLDGRDSVSSIIETYSSPRILVLDDLGKVQHKDWSLPVLWEILDNRDSWNRPTIITKQCDSKVLFQRWSTETDQGFTADSLLDRLRNSDVVTTAGKSRRGDRV